MQARDHLTGEWFEVEDDVWYLWAPDYAPSGMRAAAPPFEAQSLECRRGDGPIFPLNPQITNPLWNIADVYWRNPL